MKKKYYRSIFISDIHLGFHGCKAKELTQWLKGVKCDYLFLLGDIVDVWALRSKFYWPEAHTHLVRAILKVAKNTKLTVYTPGNHDRVFKQGFTFGNILVTPEYIHEAADGKKYLCLHGDKHDGVLAQNKFLVTVGCWLYDLLLHISSKISQARSLAGRVHWSLSKYLKHKVKAAVNYVSKYEQTVVSDAKEHNVDGVICGHIHSAGILNMRGVEYINCGDWVESLTVVTEDEEGVMSVIDVNSRKFS